MPVQNAAAQIGHACLAAGNTFEQDINISNIVILQVENEHELEEAEFKLGVKEIKFETFFESEYPVGKNALCTEPITSSQRSAFRKYKLWTTE